MPSPSDPESTGRPLDSPELPDAPEPLGTPVPLGTPEVGAIDLSGLAAAEVLRELAAEAQAVDGSPPFSDQSLVDARSGDATVIGGVDAAAILRPGEAELVVRPSLRRAGLGSLLLRSILDVTEGHLAVWAHGDHPGARRLAETFGFDERRRLLQQRATVAKEAPPARLPEGTSLRPFRLGTDDSAWLDLNARAFASHPEQGGLGQADLDARAAEPWFDTDDFLLLWRGDDLLAFCWLKVAEGEPGEFYAVGVAPEHQGEHLGGAVVDAGFARLAERGLDTASLYVEGDNTAALRLYAARGFVDFTVDVQYVISR